ncbi:MAG: hypothetical protein HY607_09500 [Planctomycetes bacterium]|uniref:hypothetical protein n=1 Tax=Candidatus Wunengus californicus TaxID=3367619 RepID=UPI004025E392|nr:hypothetical protein [Planctomycetota bacterium]
MNTKKYENGIYMSYNERKNGDFQEAVDISNNRDYVVWLDKSLIKRKLTNIIIKITGQKRYYEGKLLEIKYFDTINYDINTHEANHRPKCWRNGYSKPPIPGKDFKSVFYISELREVEEPPEVKEIPPPQRPVYF